MKRKGLMGFTLVEILIVIVIIGILIGALVPRMSAAQGRARDVARKNSLSQIQSAIIVSQQDKGNWPCVVTGGECPSSGTAMSGMTVNHIKTLLERAGMNSVPSDPLGSSKPTGFGTNGWNTLMSEGEFNYIVVSRNQTEKAGFVLMAQTEVEGGSNRIVCSTGTTLDKGYITGGTSVQSIIPCNTFVKTGSVGGCSVSGGVCTYDSEGELRYILYY